MRVHPLRWRTARGILQADVELRLAYGRVLLSWVFWRRSFRRFAAKIARTQQLQQRRAGPAPLVCLGMRPGHLRVVGNPGLQHDAHSIYFQDKSNQAATKRDVSLFAKIFDFTPSGPRDSAGRTVAFPKSDFQCK